MHDLQNICLLNDSFPPQIDGVANTILNYARQLETSGARPVVVTPSHPKAEDHKYSFPVVRYPSVTFRMMDGYMVGFPFSVEVAKMTSAENPVLLHTHCPIMSTFMARQIRQIADAPIVLTYHTKFDVDIANLVKSKHLQSACKKALVANINACDEVWTVSRGAGENMRSLGYDGDYIVMPNGVDLPLGRVSDEQIISATQGYDLPVGVPVYLFVGRMMWYKGIKIILDALAHLKLHGKDFRMVFIGEGDDREEIQQYAGGIGIGSQCIFTGAIRNRNTLRAWYSRSDLFLFPSSYDTNGLVVREAAACELGSVLIKDSCAAEGVTDNRNGFLIDENAESMSRVLLHLYDNRTRVREVGKCAGAELYISWEDAVKTAMERYQIVLENYHSGVYSHRFTPTEGFMKLNGELMECLAKLSAKRKI